MEKRRLIIEQAQIKVLFEDMKEATVFEHWSDAVNQNIDFAKNLLNDEEIKEKLKEIEYKELFLTKLMDKISFYFINVQSISSMNNRPNAKKFINLYNNLADLFSKIALINTNEKIENDNIFSKSIISLIKDFKNPNALLEKIGFIINSNYALSKDINSLIREDMTPIYLVLELLKDTEENSVNEDRNNTLIKTIFDNKKLGDFIFVSNKEYLLQKHVLSEDYIFKHATNKQINKINNFLYSKNLAEFIMNEDLIQKYFKIENNQIIFDTKVISTDDKKLDVNLTFFIPQFIRSKFTRINCYEFIPESNNTYTIKVASKEAIYIYKFDEKDERYNQDYIHIVYQSILNVLIEKLSPIYKRNYSPFENLEIRDFEEALNKNFRKYHLETKVLEQENHKILRKKNKI